MTCPGCQGEMTIRSQIGYDVAVCGQCEGIFLRRADLGSLIEAETDWHSRTGPMTQPMPRITSDMAAPPPAQPSARAFVETLFRL